MANRLQTSYDGVTALNCLPGGIQKFISNVSNAIKDKTFILKLANASNKCSGSNVVYYITNGSVTCEGSCATFEQITLSFVDITLVPTSYYFTAGCAGSNIFTYGTFSDLTTFTTIYTTFNYKGTGVLFNSEKRCLQKAIGCVPGGTMTGGNALDGQCALDTMTAKCKNDLNSKCKASGLSNQTIPVPTTLPKNCDYVTQGLYPTSDDFVTSCFKWIANTYFKRSVTISTVQLQNNTILATNIDQQAFRILQNDYAMVVPVADDVSTTVTTFSDVQLSSSDVTVDGSTSTSAGSVSDGLNDVSSNSNAVFIQASTAVLIILTFLF